MIKSYPGKAELYFRRKFIYPLFSYVVMQSCRYLFAIQYLSRWLSAVQISNLQLPRIHGL